MPVFLFISGFARPFVKVTPRLICLLLTTTTLPFRSAILAEPPEGFGPSVKEMDGGLSPEITTMDQVKRIVRPTDVPDTGLLCDLLWADPEKGFVGRASSWLS